MFTTSMPLSPAYVSASTVGWRKKKPESWPARMFTSVTFGATPAMPRPFSARGDRPGDVRAVTVVVLVRRVVQELGCSHGPSIDGMSVVKLRRQRRVEVRRDVGMGAVDAGVDDADEHALVARLVPVRPVRRGVDHRHVPLQAGERDRQPEWASAAASTAPDAARSAGLRSSPDRLWRMAGAL